MSALRYINSVNTNGVSNVTLDNVFTSDFDVYYLTVTNPYNSTSSYYCALRFVDNGYVEVGTNYEFTAQSFLESGIGSSYSSGFAGIYWAGYSSTISAGVSNFWITNVNDATRYATALGESTGGNNNPVSLQTYGYIKDTKAFTGINFAFYGANTFDDITLHIFGLKKE